MTEIEQVLIEFSDFLEEHKTELVKSDYGSCLEDIYGQLTDIIDNQEAIEYTEFDPGFSSELMDNDDD
jgi:hypothetical protein